MVGVSVLNAGDKRSCERDRRIKVESIDGGATAGAVCLLHRSTVELIGERVLAITPGAKEVIFRAGSVDGRRLLSIDKEHVVALAKPIVLVLKNRHGDSDEVALPFRVHP